MKPVPLADILLELDSGGRPQGGSNGLAEGVASIGAEHLDGRGGFNLTSTRWIPEEFYDQMSKGQVRRGNILIVKDGATTGKTSYVDERFPFERAAVNEHVFRLAVQARCADSAYVFHYLASPRGQREILKDFRGATVGGISRGFASKVCVPLPCPDDPKRSLAEQKRIAAILDKADAIRRRRQEMVDTSQRLLPSLMDELATTSRPPLVPLGDLCEKIVDGVHKTPRYVPTGVPFLTVRNLTRDFGSLSFEECKYITETDHADFSRRTDPRVGDILVSKDGTIGVACEVTDPRSFNIFVSVAQLRPRPSLIHATYLTAQLNSPFVQRQIASTTKGIAIRHLHLEDFKRLQIPVPAPQVQQRFVAKASKVSQTVAALRRAVDESQILFAALVQRAFRGEL